MGMFKFFEKKPTPDSVPGMTIFSEEDNSEDLIPQKAESQRGSENPTQQNVEVTLVPAYETGGKSSQTIESNPSGPSTAEQIIQDLNEAVLEYEQKFDDSSLSKEYVPKIVLSGVATEQLIFKQQAEAALVIAQDAKLIEKLLQNIAYFQDFLNRMAEVGYVPAKFDTNEELKQVREEIERLASLPERNSTDAFTLRVLTKLYDEKISRLTDDLSSISEFPEDSLQAKILRIKGLMRGAEAEGRTDDLNALALEADRLYQELIAQKQKPPKLADVTMNELTLVDKGKV
jgi:hypothetical protein